MATLGKIYYQLYQRLGVSLGRDVGGNSHLRTHAVLWAWCVRHLKARGDLEPDIVHCWTVGDGRWEVGGGNFTSNL